MQKKISIISFILLTSINIYTKNNSISHNLPSEIAQSPRQQDTPEDTPDRKENEDKQDQQNDDYAITEQELYNAHCMYLILRQLSKEHGISFSPIDFQHIALWKEFCNKTNRRYKSPLELQFQMNKMARNLIPVAGSTGCVIGAVAGIGGTTLYNKARHISRQGILQFTKKNSHSLIKKGLKEGAHLLFDKDKVLFSITDKDIPLVNTHVFIKPTIDVAYYILNNELQIPYRIQKMATSCIQQILPKQPAQKKTRRRSVSVGSIDQNHIPTKQSLKDFAQTLNTQVSEPSATCIAKKAATIFLLSSASEISTEVTYQLMRELCLKVGDKTNTDTYMQAVFPVDGKATTAQQKICKKIIKGLLQSYVINPHINLGTDLMNQRFGFGITFEV